MTELATTQGGGTTRSRNAAMDLKAYLESPGVLAKLTEAAGSAVKVDDLVRLTLIAASRSPDIFKCSRESILRALMDAAALGIKPGGLMGRGYLVPRKNNKNGTYELTFDPGWRGLIDIARRSGQIRRIEAHVVFAADVFEVTRTPLTNIRHVPSEKANPGEVRAAYSAAEFIGGDVQVEVLYRRDIDKIRTLGAGGGPWATWFDEMARKSAVRRLCKYLPYDPQLDKAIRVMDAADGDDGGGGPAAALEEPVAEKLSAAKRLANKIRRTSGEDMPPPPASEPPQPSVDREEYDAVTGEIVPPEREPGDD